jgi:hypothetical protein
MEAIWFVDACSRGSRGLPIGYSRAALDYALWLKASVLTI